MFVRRLLLASAVCVVAFGAHADQAWGCSLAPAPSVEQIVSDDPLPEYAEADHAEAGVVLGVYEYEHIARSSGVFGDRSVTVITRYWGKPPADLGTKVIRTGCGSWARDSGSVGYWWIDAFHAERFPDWRSSLTLDDTVQGLDSHQSELLTARFGDPIEVGVSPLTGLWAFAVAWQWELIALVVAAVTIGWLVRRRSVTGAEPTQISADAAD